MRPNPVLEPLTDLGDYREPLLAVRDLTVEFHTKRGIVQAVSDVSFDLQPGERLAIVGESGSGKSVMTMSLLHLIAHPGRIVRGTAVLDGVDILALKGKALRSIRGGTVTMVFQDPMTSLNPVIRISEQITAPMRRHLGLSAKDAHARAVEMLRQTGIPDAEKTINLYPHELSGGMRQRVLIAMALGCESRLLIADEPTTALDVTIQAQIVALLKEVSERNKSAVIFVTHDMGLVARFAHRVAVMYGGRIVEQGNVGEIFANPQHPYTRGLLASIPAIDGEKPDRLWQIDGTPPDLVGMGLGCSFAPRCPSANTLCTHIRPLLERRGFGHEAACWVSDSRNHIKDTEEILIAG
jgi:peptide/nickel transport system ATP-binding protein